MSHRLFVKNMVCPRCVKVLRQELEAVALPVLDVEIGIITLEEDPTEAQLSAIENILRQNGFEILSDRKKALVEQIKTLIREKIHFSDEIEEGFPYSAYLADQTHADYHYLSSTFSSVEPITIEKFIIQERIEKAKELLRYGQLTLSEIAYRLGYSSVHYLSNQFKKVTGMTPTEFKKSRSLAPKPSPPK